MGVESGAMRIGGQMSRDGRALAALVAMFALMVQALVPAAAMATTPDAAGLAVICTQNGTATVSFGSHPSKPKGFAGMPCQDCLAAALAVIPAPELAIQHVTYVTARVEHVLATRLLEPRARAPPRPPGQGPPTA